MEGQVWSQLLRAKSVILFTLFLAAVGCNEYQVKKVSGGFTGEVQNIIINNCVQCHAGGQSEGGFGNIDSAEAIISTGRVIPGDPANSLLYQKISDPPYGARMPYGAPRLSNSQIESVATWINSYRKRWNVVASASSGLTLNTATVTVENGESATFILTVSEGYNLSTAVGGSCTTGSWSGSTYTTGPIESACSVEFSATNPNALNLTLGENNSTTVTVTPTTVGERRALYPTASVNLASNSNATSAPSYNISSTVGGTCPQGTWSGNKYTTGALSSECTVVFTVANPCGTSHVAGTDDVYSWIRLNALGGGAVTQDNVSGGNCVGCHKVTADPATAGIVATKGTYCINSASTGCNASASANAYTEYSRILNPYCNNTGNGDSTFPCATLNSGLVNAGGVVPNDPLNSWIYRAITSAYPGPNRMPKTASCTATGSTTKCLQQSKIDAVCNWIWKGALDN